MIIKKNICIKIDGGDHTESHEHMISVLQTKKVKFSELTVTKSLAMIGVHRIHRDDWEPPRG